MICVTHLSPQLLAHFELWQSWERLGLPRWRSQNQKSLHQWSRCDTAHPKQRGYRDCKWRKDQPALGQGYRLNTYLGQVLSIGFFGSYSTMLHYPLIRSKLLSTITSVVTKAPGAIDQVLLRKANKILCLQESDKALVSDVILIWPLRTQVAMESPRGRFEQHLTWVEGSGGRGSSLWCFFVSSLSGVILLVCFAVTVNVKHAWKGYRVKPMTIYFSGRSQQVNKLDETAQESGKNPLLGIR